MLILFYICIHLKYACVCVSDTIYKLQQADIGKAFFLGGGGGGGSIIIYTHKFTPADSEVKILDC